MNPVFFCLWITSLVWGFMCGCYVTYYGGRRISS